MMEMAFARLPELREGGLQVRAGVEDAAQPCDHVAVADKAGGCDHGVLRPCLQVLQLLLRGLHGLGL